MPKLNSFTIRIRTGSQGREDLPKFKINGFPLGFTDVSGGVGPGESCDGNGHPQSVAHSLILCGPEKGTWSIEETEVTYCLAGEEPYTIHFGPVCLDDQSDMNLWQERPLPVFDV